MMVGGWRGSGIRSVPLASRYEMSELRGGGGVGCGGGGGKRPLIPVNRFIIFE